MRKIVVIATLLLSVPAVAQVPVLDAAGTNTRGNQQSAGNELVVSLYNQLEALQSEVQTLRGIVEEQGYQLQRLQTESKDRYLDVDRRLSEVISNGATGLPGMPAVGGAGAMPGTAAGTTAASVAGVSSLGTTVTPGLIPESPLTPPVAAGSAASAGAPPVVLDEQELYRTALNLLLEESKYDESISQFQVYVDAFPQGRLLTNALYWQGEAMILVKRYQEAIAVFDRLLNDFPQDPKAAGAMLKKGVAYSQMNDRQQAEAIWRELPARYPDNSPEIKAAQDYLRR